MWCSKVKWLNRWFFFLKKYLGLDCFLLLMVMVLEVIVLCVWLWEGCSLELISVCIRFVFFFILIIGMLFCVSCLKFVLFSVFKELLNRYLVICFVVCKFFLLWIRWVICFVSIYWVCGVLLLFLFFFFRVLIFLMFIKVKNFRKW